ERSILHPPSQLTKRWHAEPPPILQKPCLAVDRVHGRTYMIGYDSQNTLTFNFINSNETCLSDEDDDDFDWRTAQWTSLPYPGGGHAARKRFFDTENCFLSSDYQFIVPTFETHNGEGGFSIWNHWDRAWKHARISTECSCHEEAYEKGSKAKVKKDAKHIKFEYPNRLAVVYQSLKTNVAHRRISLSSSDSDRYTEAIDTVVIHWRDAKDRDHLTGVQLVNGQVNSCHDIKIGREVLPRDLTLVASPNNPYHYTHKNSPQKLYHHGDHASRCENTTLFFFGPQGSGWFDIEIADRPSTRPVDILFMRHGAGKGGFHAMPALQVKHPRAVYYRGQLWIFGKNNQGVGVWSIDTSSTENTYEFVPQSQGSQSPGGLACASCGTGIIVYGGCDSAKDCSTNLRPGEDGHLDESGKVAPVSIYRPGGDQDEDDDDDEDDDSNEEEEDSDEHDEQHGHDQDEDIEFEGEGNYAHGHGSGTGSHGGTSSSGSDGVSGGSGSRGSGDSSSGDSGSGDSSSGDSGSGGSGSDGSGSGSSGSGSGSGSSGSGSGGSGSGGSGSGGSGSGGSGSGGSGSGGSGSGGSGTGGSGSGGSGSGGSGSGGSGSGGSGSGGSGSGGSGSGGSGSGGSGSGGSGSNGSGSGSSGSAASGSGSSSGGTAGGGSQSSSGSWSPASGVPAGTVPEGVPGTISPIPVVLPNPFPNPDASASVPVLIQGTPTGSVFTTPTNIPGSDIPDNSRASGDDDQKHKNLGPILGGIFGFLGLIVLVALLFVAARRRRNRNEAAAVGGAASPDDSELGGAGPDGPEGIFVPGGPSGQSKYASPSGGETTNMPPLAQVGGPSSNTGAPFGGPAGGPSDVPSGPSSASGSTAGPGGPSGAAIGAVAAAGGAVLLAGAIANKHKNNESKTEHNQIFDAEHTVHDNEGVNNGVLTAKRSSKAKFFMGGGDYKPPTRRTSPVGLPAGPTGPNTTLGPTNTRPSFEDFEKTGTASKEEHDHNGKLIAGAVGVVLGAGAIAVAQHTSSSSKDGQNGSSSKKTTTTTTTTTTSGPGGSSSSTTQNSSGKKPIFIGGDKQEVIVDSDNESKKDLILHGHGRNQSSTSSGTAMMIGDDHTSTIMHHSGSTSTTSVVTGEQTTTGSSGHIIVGSNKPTTVLTGTHSGTITGERVIGGVAAAGGAILVGQQMSQKQQQQVNVQKGAPTIHKTQITLKLSIIRYERSDAAQATPLAKPGTLMFSQVEMIEAAPEINIPGSAFSHVRDSSKVTGQEDDLPSPVVPGPRGAATSSESEPRERSLRWMKNEFQWKREAGMLQHLRSDLYIAELFTLYSLPSFAEYRFVSVMGPFSRTLETYIKERRGIQTAQPSSVMLANPQGPFTLPELKNLTDSISSALKWCHDHHVVHLNLTPSSIFLQELYSEPDGQGGYRTSVYSSYSNKSFGADNASPDIEHRWKIWNFNQARFVGESVDLTMDTTAYTSPEILIAAHRFRQQSGQDVNQAEGPSEQGSSLTTSTTSVSAGGVVTKTVTTKSSSNSIAGQVSASEPEKLMAAMTMDMWSLGQIVYELHTCQPMFKSDEDALEKLTSAEEKRVNGSPSSSSLGSSGSNGSNSGGNEGGDNEEDDGDDLDRAKSHSKIRHQLQHQIAKIEEIPVLGAREVITGLLEMRQERRLDHEEIRTLYLDVQE
ncbi:hypothetical protein BG004_006604, partial [Podila humilis]